MGLDDLRAALARVADRSVVRDAAGPVRLYIDRVFTLRGIGTVVTGTLWSGTIAEGDVLHVAPGGGEVRVRSVQVHDAPVEQATAGERVALGVPGVDRSDVHRGDALVTPGAFPVSYRLDVELEELVPIDGGARVSVHHGTSRIPARVARVGTQTAQLRLEAPVVAARGDRVVLRGETTLGGATVLDPAPPRRLDEERLELLERGDPASIVSATVHAPVSVESLRARGLLAPKELEEGLAAVVQAGGWAFSQMWLEETRESVVERLRARADAEPLEPGLAVAELLPPEPWAPAVLPLLPVERRGGMAYLPGVAASLGARAAAAEELTGALEEAGLGGGEGRRRRSSRGTWKARAGSCGSATASSSRRLPTSARASSWSPSARPRVRSRLPGSAISRGWAVATRSCCWSASTRTGSRAASATAACCDGQDASRRPGGGSRRRQRCRGRARVRGKIPASMP